MNPQRWISRRTTDWQALETLLNQVERRGLRSLDSSQIRRLASLYRAVCGDFTRAQTQQLSPLLVNKLQTLTQRGYNQIYQGPRHPGWHSVLQFYRWRLPLVIRQTLPYTLTAVGIFGLGGLVAWWYARQDPHFLSLVLPADIINQVQNQGKLWVYSILGTEPEAASGIMTNNMEVAFQAIGGGILAGLYTTYLLFTNGLMLGCAAVLVAKGGLAYPFWAFVFPHGSLELPAIFLAGGAGLLIARGLLFPGPYRRTDSLWYCSRRAAELTYGIVPLLAVAGTIEGFFSPSLVVPSSLKYLAGVILFFLLVLYCSLPSQGGGDCLERTGGDALFTDDT